MGLNQFAEFREERRPDFTWRKHAALQEFMERLYEEKYGGNRDDLNCRDMELDKDDIESLRQAILNNYEDYKSEGGFFYGHEYQDESIAAYKELDLKFCDEAIAAIDRGLVVIYSCWW